MAISLQHNNKVLHTTAAAFLNGDSPLVWLQEISRWNIAPDQLSCYMLPQSIQSQLPGGLLVIAKNTNAIRAENLLNPYGVVAGKLFIPVHCSIYPECTAAELEKMLIWDVQVLHPTIGFVGFEYKDAVPLADFFEFTASSSLQWNHAHTGLSPHSPLQQIQVLQPKPEDIIAGIRKDLDVKPLGEIPGAKEGSYSIFDKGLDAVKFGLLKGLYSATGLVNKMLQALPGTNQIGENSSENNLLQQWQQWLQQNIETIEKRRQDEIQRLLNMFEDNMDEALQYAIPLDSRYADRGSAMPSASLTRRSTLFNLNKLGGGTAVDGWDIGNDYYSLRAKYLAAAKKQTEKNDFKKAAYIYAHLLGDFAAAANVLVQGKYYREAAALYKDHLHNPQAAAECLENGGLIIEAIEVYKTLDKSEKIGDLYKQLEQTEQANTFFEKTIMHFLKAGNHFEAARVMHDKKGEDNRAKEVLLQGWQTTQQPEKCLKQYFDIVALTERERVQYHMEKIYRNIADYKQVQFLNVLQHIKQQYADEQLEDRSIEIAYEIVSHNAASGNFSLLPQLKQFVSEDRLLTPDVSRYIHKQSKQKKQEKAWSLQLDAAIKWQDAALFRNQLIVIGTKDKKLHLARCNWYNDIEYHSWAEDNKQGERFTMNAHPHYANRIIITGSFRSFIPQVILLKNKYFDQEIIVNGMNWLPAENAGIAINGDSGITVLNASGKAAALHYYSAAGKLEKVQTCKALAGEELPFYNSSNPSLLYENNCFYTFQANLMVEIGASGRYAYCKMPSGIRRFAISKLSPDLKHIVSTNAGCFLLRYKGNGLQIAGEVFAVDQIPSSIEFISSDRFVLAEKNSIHIYEVNGDTVELIREENVLSRVIAVVASSTRGKFATVEESGNICLHDI